MSENATTSPPLQTVADGKAPIPARKPRGPRGPGGRFAPKKAAESPAADGPATARLDRKWLYLAGGIAAVLALGWWGNRTKAARETADDRDDRPAAPAMPGAPAPLAVARGLDLNAGVTL